MLEIIKKFEDIIKNISIEIFEEEFDLLRFKAKIIFNNDSILKIKEYHFSKKSRKYSYHWMNNNNELIIRWDNSKHWEDVNTFPHHKHLADNSVQDSFSTNLEDVLSEIYNHIKK